MAGRRPSVSVSYRQRENYWTIRWREHGRQREQGGYATEDEAQDDADTIRKRLRQGLPGARAPRRIADIVEHWWDTYVTTGSVAQSTRETYRIDARRILDTIGDADANTTPGRIRQWRDQLAADYGPRAANKAHTALSSAYERALEAHPPLVETNPCRGIRRMPETLQARIIPTRLHVEYLERTAPSPRELALLMLASRCGVRQSELFGLSWTNVRERAIFVAEVADRGRVIRTSTKTKRSERRVPMPPRTRAAVDAIRPPGIARGLLFPSPTDPDRPLDRSAWAKVHFKRWRRAAAWLAAQEGQGPDVWGELLHIDWKHLRHHAISRWATATHPASMLQVSRWSGDSLATIDKHYAFLFDEDEDDVMDAID
jgi:integrase